MAKAATIEPTVRMVALAFGLKNSMRALALTVSRQPGSTRPQAEGR